MLIVGVVGLGASLAGAVMQLLPRQFSAHQRQQILDWEAGQRWRELPAGTIFPALVKYPAPSKLGGALTLHAIRIGIAKQASCPAAADPAVGRVLTRSGCQAMLRATYADATNSFVVTVGVAAFPSAAQANAARREISGLAPSGVGRLAPGVGAVKFSNTPAASFIDRRRQISASTSAATYVVLYTIGYADKRPQVQASSNSYTYSEMTGLGAGVAQAVVSVLGAPVPPPHCPGTPGC